MACASSSYHAQWPGPYTGLGAFPGTGTRSLRVDSPERDILAERNKYHSKKSPLKGDTYDAAILAIVGMGDQDYIDTHGVTELFTQCGFAIFLHIATIFIQLALICMLFATVVESAEDPWEMGNGIRRSLELLLHIIASKHPEALRLDVEHPMEMQANILCAKDKTIPWAHCIVLCLWGSRMLQEVEETLRRAVDVWCVFKNDPSSITVVYDKDHCKVVGGVLYEEDDTIHGDGIIENHVKAHDLVSVRTWMVCVIYSCVLSLRLFVAIFITYTSAKFLMLSNGMATVIFKTVSIKFIVELDELLYNAFAPAKFKKEVSFSQFQYTARKESMRFQWVLVAVKMFVVVFSVYFLQVHIYRTLTSFREACQVYMDVVDKDGLPNHDLAEVGKQLVIAFGHFARGVQGGK